MTKEDKKLLLTDLCARLPYGIVCDCLHSISGKATAINAKDMVVYYTDCDEWESIEYCKPYLHPISSMTEEEENAYRRTWYDPLFDSATRQHTREEDLMLLAKAQHDSIMFLLENHFDYLGLIDKGLAIEVTENNNPYKKRGEE